MPDLSRARARAMGDSPVRARALEVSTTAYHLGTADGELETSDVGEYQIHKQLYDYIVKYGRLGMLLATQPVFGDFNSCLNNR